MTVCTYPRHRKIIFIFKNVSKPTGGVFKFSGPSIFDRRGRYKNFR